MSFIFYSDLDKALVAIRRTGIRYCIVGKSASSVYSYHLANGSFVTKEIDITFNTTDIAFLNETISNYSEFNGRGRRMRDRSGLVLNIHNYPLPERRDLSDLEVESITSLVERNRASREFLSLVDKHPSDFEELELLNREKGLLSVLLYQ